MRLRRLLFAGLCLWTLAAAQVAAAEAHYNPADAAPRFAALARMAPKWLPAEAIAFSPGYPDALATRAEVTELLRLQEARNHSDLLIIRSESGDLVAGFLQRLGTRPRARPQTVGLLRAVLHDVDILLFRAKFHFLRPRPHQVDPRLQPAIAVPRHPAFPSGHAGESRALAVVLGELQPSARDQLHKYAADIAHHREVAGVHYASDSREGARIGQQAAELLLQVPGLGKRLAAARAEWR